MDQLKKEASYSVGMSIGQSLQGQNLDEIDLDSFLEGIQAIFNETQLKHTPEEANQKIMAYLNAMNESRFAIYKTEGEKFLAENVQKSSITTLPSGLQYEIIENGNGPNQVQPTK